MKKRSERTSTFACSGCGEVIPLGVYAIAQLAMGHRVTFTHGTGCGAQTHLTPEGQRRQ